MRPAGVRVARFWCPLARVSISLLPAFLAARWSGTLDEVEAAVLAVEPSGGVAAAVETVHPAADPDAIGSVCAMRSIRRRLRAVRAALLAVVTLLPTYLPGVVPTITALREALSTDRVLVAIRSSQSSICMGWPRPSGFATE